MRGRNFSLKIKNTKHGKRIPQRIPIHASAWWRRTRNPWRIADFRIEFDYSDTASIQEGWSRARRVWVPRHWFRVAPAEVGNDRLRPTRDYPSNRRPIVIAAMIAIDHSPLGEVRRVVW